MKSIACLPVGICSWDFDLKGEGFSATTSMGWVEAGSIMVNRQTFEIRKKGLFSGEWDAHQGGRPIYQAKKTNPFFRDIGIRSEEHTCVLKPDSIFSRAMRVTGGGHSFVIEASHAFTRRATISGRYEDPVLVTFAFWLTILQWRRQANNNGGAAD